MVFDHEADYPSQWAVNGAIAPKIGCPPETLRSWVRQAERDAGHREGTTTSERERIKALERENRGYCDDNSAQGVEAAKVRRLHRLPVTELMNKLIAHAQATGADYPKRGQKGSYPEYLWIVMELAYLCRLRGIEVVTLNEANAEAQGLRTNRRKGSRDNIVAWTPRLRAAYQAAIDRRNHIWEKRGRAVPMKPEHRPLIASRSGDQLRKEAFNSAWQRFIHSAMNTGVVAVEDRFSPHDLKRKGITDTKGTRRDKQDASGHRSEGMLDIYDLSVPLVKTSDE